MANKKADTAFAFTKDMVLNSNQIPKILREYRTEAWKAYQELRLPSLKDEAWRRTSLRDFDFKGVKLAAMVELDEKKSKPRFGVIPENLFQERSTALLSPNGLEINLTEKLEKSGVIFSSIEKAAEDHPDLIGKILGKVISPEEGIFAAATGAFASQGIFIYVPKGIVVEEPLFSIAFSGGQSTAHFFQTLIYLEEGASLNFLQETISPFDQKDLSLTGENFEIIVGPNAHLKITELQNYNDKVWSFGHKRAHIERDGNLEWEIGALGSALSKHFVSIDLVGQGAEGRVSGMFFADQQQHLSYNTLQRHLAPRTTSDLLFKGALRGKSRSVWRGMIYVAPGAQHIDGYQANRNLVLDPDARTDSIPGLEILNNDVRCTHGSTVGKIDEEQLFYLLSRGIPRKDAEQLVIQGFFEDILSRFSLQEVGDELWTKIKDRLLA
jgi:Fe-S cluster assembly protein SufD